jgi:hypothetical protein
LRLLPKVDVVVVADVVAVEDVVVVVAVVGSTDLFFGERCFSVFSVVLFNLLWRINFHFFDFLDLKKKDKICLVKH